MLSAIFTSLHLLVAVLFGVPTTQRDACIALTNTTVDSQAPCHVDDMVYDALRQLAKHLDPGTVHGRCILAYELPLWYHQCILDPDQNIENVEKELMRRLRAVYGERLREAALLPERTSTGSLHVYLVP